MNGNKHDSKIINIKLFDISFIKFKYKKIKAIIQDNEFIKKEMILSDNHSSYKITDIISVRCSTPESESDSFTNISLSPMTICENDFVHIKDVFN
jgi:hypothetical protein